MKLMNLDKMPTESTWMRTPSVKRPLSAGTVENGLALTPPPVVNQQSETCWMLLYNFGHFRLPTTIKRILFMRESIQVGS